MRERPVVSTGYIERLVRKGAQLEKRLAGLMRHLEFEARRPCLTIREVAMHLKVPTKLVVGWMQEGRLRLVRRGNRPMVLCIEVNRFLRQERELTLTQGRNPRPQSLGPDGTSSIQGGPQ